MRRVTTIPDSTAPAGEIYLIEVYECPLWRQELAVGGDPVWYYDKQQARRVAAMMDRAPRPPMRFKDFDA